MRSAPSQQTAATTARIQNKAVNREHLYQVRIDGIRQSKPNKRAGIDQHEEKEINEVLNFFEENHTYRIATKTWKNTNWW